MDKFPEQGKVWERVDKLKSYYENKGAHFLPLSVLLNKLSLAPSPHAVNVLSVLENEGILNRVLRVESSSLGGIGDFSSYEDIPDIINDFRTGLDMEVKPEDVKILYSFVCKLS